MSEARIDARAAGGARGTTSAPAEQRRAVHHRRTSCRACGGVRLQSFLELGPQPLANSFRQSPADFADEPKYPLDVYFCESCSLVQLLDVIDPEVLFRDYIYVTGTSDTIAAHNASYAATVVELLGLGPEDLVVEVASNDGSLLRHFQACGTRVLGVEPATNIAAIAESAGVPTVNRFFDRATALELRQEVGAAKAVIGNNVLAHVDETQDFLRGCKELVHRAGLVIVEVPYLAEMIERLEYDTIYHEHLCYFSITTLMRLFQEVGLSIVRVDRVPVHGGSVRVYARPQERSAQPEPKVLEAARSEARSGLTDLSRYHRFAEHVASHRQSLRDLLQSLVEDGKSVAGYGAPAKGNTLLNYCGIDTRWLPYTTDKNPLKVGRYTPGMHIPVLPVATLLERRPEYTLILAWNFAEEIMRQQQDYRAQGGHFIIPIPEPKVL